MTTPTHTTQTSFDSLPLADALHANIRHAGFSNCTPIQAQALPLLLDGKNVAGQAQTGTGKTATFLLALFQHLLTHPEPQGRTALHPRALVLAPTRELVIQIHADAQVLGAGLGLRLGLAYGGVDYEKQRKVITDGVEILIGTPGRLIDYHRQGVYDLRMIQGLVLDEADRMFDLGFITDVRYLLRRASAPERRLNMLFSATLSQRVLELAYEHMADPELVRIDPEKVTVDKVNQVVYHVANVDKIPLLLGLLQELEPPRTMIFVNTKGGAERVWGYLESNGYRAGLMTGDVRQTTRQRLLKEFREGKLPILVATDVAARGLHIDDVSHVINFDLPQDAEDYVHRIGRTARAGATGEAISFGCETSVYSLPDIEVYIGKKIPVGLLSDAPMAQHIARPARVDEPGVVEARERRLAARSGGGGGGGRSGRQRHPDEGARASAPQPPAAPAADAGAAAAPRKRRRRRSGSTDGAAAPAG